MMLDLPALFGPKTSVIGRRGILCAGPKALKLPIVNLRNHGRSVPRYAGVLPSQNAKDTLPSSHV